MFWESQRGHFGILGNLQDSGHLNALEGGWSAVLPALRRVRGRTCENGVYLSNPQVAMAELHVPLPHFGWRAWIKGRRQSAGVQLSQGAPVNSGDEEADHALGRLVPTTSCAVVEFLPRGR